MSYAAIKRRIYLMVEKAEPGDKASARFDRFIISVIVINMVVILLETVQYLKQAYAGYFQAFEITVVIIFGIEYILRLWTITEEEQYSHPLWGRLKYIFSLEAIIDLLAIVPFFVPFIIKTDPYFLSGLRLLRLLRLFKLGRYSAAVTMVQNVIRSRREELTITFGTVLIMLVISSTLMYYIEHEAQPDNFSSIPATMWWGVATLTTVGYGDVFPVTPLGKLLGAFIAILGIGVFALPAGIIASGFESELSKRKKAEEDDALAHLPPVAPPNYCPHCGEAWHGNHPPKEA